MEEAFPLVVVKKLLTDRDWLGEEIIVMRYGHMWVLGIMASPSPSSTPSNGGAPPVNKHALTALDKQRSQLSRLLKDPSKPAYIPPPPKEKTLRPPREMMKNVQGSSAGAGSGEFHVYKANRRREYERVKIMEEESRKESEVAEFERKKREREDQAEAKTSKNRAKRMKKKERSLKKSKGKEKEKEKEETAEDDGPMKKRRLVNGNELVFRKPGEGSDEEEEEEEEREVIVEPSKEDATENPVTMGPTVMIHDSDT